MEHRKKNRAVRGASSSTKKEYFSVEIKEKGASEKKIANPMKTPEANAYFTQEVLSDYAASLDPLGLPTEFESTDKRVRGGMVIRTYQIRAGDVLMELTIMTLPDGLIDQYIISRAG